MQAINVGMLVAVNIEKYKDRPLIGKVLEVSGDSIVLEWMVGSYSGIWKEWKGREEGEVVTYTDVITIENIVCTDIHFTPSKRLPPNIIKTLKSLYADLI